MLAREQRAFDGRLVRLYKKITEADLTAAVNGTAQDIALGTFPNVGFLIRAVAKINTYFTGGGATTCTLQIGTGAGGGVNKIMTALDIFSTTTLNTWLPGTAGVQPAGRYGGVALFATITPDAGHTLLALTAGDLEVELVGCGSPDLAVNF